MSYRHHDQPAIAPNEPSTPPKKPILERLARLTHKERLALRELLPVARAGQLYGCACAADGEPLPCEHCLDAIDEDEAEALALIRQKEAEGLHGWDNIRAVAEELAWRTHYREKLPINPVLHPHLSDAWYEAKYLRFDAAQNICISQDSPVTIQAEPSESETNHAA